MSAPTYSHDSTVRAIASYYEFLSRTHPLFEPGDILYPPPDGWPQITAETIPGKNQTVIRLLQHIPYLGQPGRPLCIARTANAIQYNCEEVQKQLREEEDEEGTWTKQILNKNFPPHVILLARGGNDSYYLLIDIERGVAVWGNPRGSWTAYVNEYTRLETPLTPKNVKEDGPDWWMDNATFGIEEFCEYLKQQFRDLNWLPHPWGTTEDAGGVYEVDTFPDEERRVNVEGERDVIEIMRDAGWPGDGEAGGGWRREQARRAFKGRDWDGSWW
jgi:hypothetical protein